MICFVLHLLVTAQYQNILRKKVLQGTLGFLLKRFLASLPSGYLNDRLINKAYSVKVFITNRFP
jgi:hypothetical protein